MHGLVFNGYDFGEICEAQTVEMKPHRVRADAVTIAGGAGALMAGDGLDVRMVKVRLILNAGCRLTPGEASLLRHKIDAMLHAEQGAVLRLPEDEVLEYRFAALTDASGWTSMFEDGECTITFTCYDPVAYGHERTTNATRFEVDGTAPTYPVFECVATEGDSVMVLDLAHEKFIDVVHEFQGGERVVIDCASERVSVDGACADADVGAYSDFFSLDPGPCDLAFAGCSEHATAYTERWY